MQPGAGSLRDQLRIVAGARDFRLLLTTFVLQALATGCMLAGVDYLASDVLGKKGAATILFVCFVGPALLLTPLWSRYGARFGKKQGYLLASVILAAGALLNVTAREAPVAVVFVATALVGVGYAGAQVFPLAMLPDAAAVDARRTGSGRVGVYTGVWTAGETLGLALGPGLFAVVLTIGSYRSSTDGDIAQPDSALNAITLGFSVLPAALILLSLLWLVRYSLTSAEVEPHDRHPGPAQGAPGRRPARPRRAHAGLRLRLRAARHRPDRSRGRRRRRRVERPRPDRVPQPAARWRTTWSGSGCASSTARPARSERSPAAAPSRCCSPSRAPATPAPTSTRPAMVLPSTRHAAFDKAAHYFGVEKRSCRSVPDFRADLAATEAALDDDVVLVVGSAPSYAHGVMDPIPELAALAAARGIRCHVDACIGGWVLPYAARLGRDVPPWTFAVDGVTSISVDLHKYGYAPKGTSLLLHRTAGAAATPVLRLGRLARLHDAQLDDPVDEVRRAAGRGLGRRAVARRRGLLKLTRSLRRRRPDRRRDRGDRGAVPGVAARLLAGRARDRRHLRRVHGLRRDARPRLVRPAADVLRRHGPTIHLSVSAATRAHVDEFLAALGESVAAAQDRAGRGRPRGRVVHRDARPGRTDRRRLRRPARGVRSGRSKATAASSRSPTGWPRSTRCSTSPRPPCARPCWWRSWTGCRGPAASSDPPGS